MAEMIPDSPLRNACGVFATLAVVLFTGCATAPSGAFRVAPPSPSGPIVLFDGSDTEAWAQLYSGLNCAWTVEDRSLVVRPGAGSIRTRDDFLDFTLFVEFSVPASPPGVEGQGRGNSGVYLLNRYEIQILDSWEQAPDERGCGALYGRRAPDRNAAKPPGTWQTYLIQFTAPRFDAEGRKTENARLTVHHNGVRIHDDVEVEGKTGAGAREAPGPGPIVLQDHGSRVRFRRIWIDPV